MDAVSCSQPSQTAFVIHDNNIIVWIDIPRWTDSRRCLTSEADSGLTVYGKKLTCSAYWPQLNAISTRIRRPGP